MQPSTPTQMPERPAHDDAAAAAATGLTFPRGPLAAKPSHCRHDTCIMLAERQSGACGSAAWLRWGWFQTSQSWYSKLPQL